MESKKSVLEVIICKGLCENVRKLQECVTNYETKVTGFSTQDGLLMRHDDTEAGFALYSWLCEIGFVPVIIDHPVLQLASGKVREGGGGAMMAVIAVVSRHVNISSAVNYYHVSFVS